MKRTIININEDKCTGCGLCVSGCHEGALQIIDGKARLINDLFCDGLGACIGDCPEGAIVLEEREAVPYDEIKVMEILSTKGSNTIYAHLRHLRDHNEHGYVKQGVDYLIKNNIDIDLTEFTQPITNKTMEQHQHHAGCPGSMARDFRENKTASANTEYTGEAPSELRQWPVQLHLVNPGAAYFKSADVVLAADCVAFAMGNFHQRFLKGKSLAIACPKLDSNKEVYVNKLTSMIDDSKINTLTVVIMEVPCCGGLMQMAKLAAQQATRKVPIKIVTVSLQGEVISEEWA